MECKKLEDGQNIAGIETVHVNKQYLYNFKSIGLHGYYYKSDNWTNSPLTDEILNINMCLSGGAIQGQSAIWKGNIIIPSTDVYRIFANCNGYVRIIIDGKYYWEQPNGGGEATNRIESYFKNRKLVRSNDFKLSAGKHPIEIYCSNTSILELEWSGSALHSAVPVPVDAFEPDYQITKN